MSLISNIQSGGGLVAATSKVIMPVANLAPPPAETTPSPLFPPVTASPNSAAIMLETATPPEEDKADLSNPQSDVEVDDIPASNDEAVLTDDIDTPGAAIQPPVKQVEAEYLLTPAVAAPQTLEEPVEKPSAKDHLAEARSLAGAAKRAYHAERLIADITAAPDNRLAELNDNPAKQDPETLAEDPTPQP